MFPCLESVKPNFFFFLLKKQFYKCLFTINLFTVKFCEVISSVWAEVCVYSFIQNSVLLVQQVLCSFYVAGIYLFTNVCNWQWIWDIAMQSLLIGAKWSKNSCNKRVVSITVILLLYLIFMIDFLVWNLLLGEMWYAPFLCIFSHLFTAIITWISCCFGTTSLLERTSF